MSKTQLEIEQLKKDVKAVIEFRIELVVKEQAKSICLGLNYDITPDDLEFIKINIRRAITGAMQMKEDFNPQ